jgi:hypothetical protein
MKNKLKIFEVIALIIWSVFFTWNSAELNNSSNHAVLIIEEEIQENPQVADWTSHQASDGLIERRVVSGELTDQEKLPVGGLGFSLSASYQNAVRFSLLEINSASDFFRERDLPVFYHNLRI